MAFYHKSEPTIGLELVHTCQLETLTIFAQEFQTTGGTAARKSQLSSELISRQTMVFALHLTVIMTSDLHACQGC